MSKILPTSKFKRQYKRVRKDTRWNRIFNGTVPFEDSRLSPWQYIINCFLEDLEIPKYFYEHPITLTTQQKKEIKQRLGEQQKISIRGLDLHFDGHNGDHLLIYVRTDADMVYLIGIGTHSDLF